MRLISATDQWCGLKDDLPSLQQEKGRYWTNLLFFFPSFEPRGALSEIDGFHSNGKIPHRTRPTKHRPTEHRRLLVIFSFRFAEDGLSVAVIAA